MTYFPMINEYKKYNATGGATKVRTGLLLLLRNGSISGYVLYFDSHDLISSRSRQPYYLLSFTIESTDNV